MPFAYVLRRLLQVVPVVLAIAVLNFFLLRLAPGDMADVMAGEAGAATPEYLAQLRAQFGIDQPLGTQFASYIGKLLRLDLGWSFRNGQSVISLILERLPATALLMILSLALATAIGCALGTLAGATRWRWLDMTISTVATVGFATPLFWLGLMLIVLFSVRLGWLPSSGMVTLGVTQTGWTRVIDVARHLVLPAACLTVYYIAIYARLMRTSVSEVSRLDFVRTARAKGLTSGATLRGHIVPNALLPIVTMTALQFGALFSGSVAIETVFGWPGLGQLALSAVTSRDLNLLLGILFVSSLFVLLVNLLTDLVYAWFDPRVELK
ncbi:ABC transporter permease [Chitinasiproducens palmae]|uniref:Peptide/nickel transport system permease protein n=1 Tax=Chitinasiproducens palmae TaxID=1770053 RepID=A0A1H2PJD9_9BURK|nr:ABC transporter permease [Chitinasiproducens palmae]SDV46499.1 peptide/nickel transport system permease protein [Chitinasiproducens palmae]